MALTPGDRLGPYVIQVLMGTGGMGEVYRGRDIRLGRDVALKVISPQRVGDPRLRRRFEIEARAASALNHPSIVTIYDVGETDGIPWIAMEWVEGKTLRDALDARAGPLPIHDVVSFARQIADGLAAAHAKGVIHRDLKPSNVMVAGDARCKILDFGLARQTLSEAGGAGRSDVETLGLGVDHATREGTILGTVGYMSPEQASGRPVDFRTDQFSFGLIVYEMLTGQRAFERETPAETLAAVLRDDPPAAASLRPDTPETLKRVVAVCLSKRPEDRFASTRQLAALLDSLATSSPAAAHEAGAMARAPTLTDVALPSGASARRYRRAALTIGAAVVLPLALAAGLRFRAARSAIDSVAVLPFENANRDPDADYLSDGLTESLIDQLSRLPSLRVMARATAFRFKGTADPQEAGRKLAVRAVLTGTVARRGDRISISAELVEIPSGVRLWGDRYERPFADLPRVGDSIALDIATRLRVRLSRDDVRELERHGTEDPEAYDLFLKGRHLLAKDTEEDDLEARRLFERAVEKDPKFTEAHLALGGSYVRGAAHGWLRPAEAWPRAQDALRTALDLDPGNVLVRCALANRRFLFDWDWAAAEREYGALVHDPRVLRGETFRPIPMFLWARGRPDDAVELMERALRVDPANLESRIMMADFLAHAGRLEDATRQYEALVETDPSHPAPLFGLAEVLRRRGQVTGAIHALLKAYEANEEEYGMRALATARTEQDLERAGLAVTRARLGNLQELANERYIAPLDLARLEAQAGEREKAFASLERAFAERSPGLLFLKVDRAWDGVRDDARFADLVRRVGIP